jgi:deazaflavin-dependent oxidoreductase (nitroreductase family)
VGAVLKRIGDRIGPTSWGTNLLRRVLPAGDRVVLRLSRGRHTLTERSMPCLVLHTIGRRTGQPREQPLLYVRHGEGYAVAGSNWGQAHHPSWSANLLAHPEAEIVVDGERHHIAARLVTDEERAQLWPRFDAMYPGYASYRARAADRQIRMFVLSPNGSLA